LPARCGLNPATGWITGDRSTPGHYDVAAICDITGLAAAPSLPLHHFVSGITITPDPSVIAATWEKHPDGEPPAFANLS